LIELLQLPSLNIRGMASSRVGNQASNVIPSTATAALDMRLVKGMDARETVVAGEKRPQFRRFCG
jgi:acetylornithine deacetylase/succinyl-diaminopimelate desuccinylase-like protein